ncbi:SRPBCC family protein [Candidatus Sumerlaeota bacterium]|nr:SRPBCC family protein [Candidatus Sumerlaeota bacterium]
MKIHLLTSEIWLPCTPEAAFAFCSDLDCLAKTIPPRHRFRLLTPGPLTLELGTVIDYKVRLHGFPIRWRGEITAWEPPHRFVDEQTRGPYRLWHHEHIFEERDGGTVCHDRIHYAHAGGWLVHRLLVKPDLDRIWAYRLRVIREHFGVDQV